MSAFSILFFFGYTTFFELKEKNIFFLKIFWYFAGFTLSLHLKEIIKVYINGIMPNFIYSREKTIEAKKTIGRYAAISEFYKKCFAPSKYIGNCTNLFRKLKPIDHSDFCDKYFKYAEEHKEDMDIWNRGLTVEEFEKEVDLYYTIGNRVSRATFDRDIYLNDLLCHIITETYDGKIQEQKFMEFLEKKGYECGFFDGEIDADYGVDIKVTNPRNGNVSAIQVKPITFFKSNRSDVYADRVALVHKYYKCLNDFGIKTYYAIYNKDVNSGNVSWQKNQDGGYRYRINELFSYDIEDINSTFKDIPFKENLCELKV